MNESRAASIEAAEQPTGDGCWVNVDALSDDQIWDWHREHYGNSQKVCADAFRAYAKKLAEQHAGDGDVELPEWKPSLKTAAPLSRLKTLNGVASIQVMGQGWRGCATRWGEWASYEALWPTREAAAAACEAALAGTEQSGTDDE